MIHRIRIMFYVFDSFSYFPRFFGKAIIWKILFPSSYSLEINPSALKHKITVLKFINKRFAQAKKTHYDGAILFYQYYEFCSLQWSNSSAVVAMDRIWSFMQGFIFWLLCFHSLALRVRNHSFLHPSFLSLKHGLPSCPWWRNAASYPQLLASPVWSKLCPGCFLPHIGTVLRLPFAHYGSLNSPIRELQCGNFPAKDRDMSLKTALGKDTFALVRWVITVLNTQNISLYPTYAY